MSTPGPGPEAFCGFAGVALSIALANIGAGYGTCKSGVGIVGMGSRKPNLIMKSLIPVVMAGILGIYGMIVSVILMKDVSSTNYTFYKGYQNLAAGLCVGMSSAGAGYAIGIVGDIGVRKTSEEPRIFIGMLLILIFAEALGLYGMIVAILLSNQS